MKQLPEDSSVLVIQTAFPGDVILTLPLIQSIKNAHPKSVIDLVVTPLASGVVKNHPAVHETIVYDKRGRDAGITGFGRLVRILRSHRYTIAFVPHRSMRSALLVWVSGIPARIGFGRSAGRVFFSSVVKYQPDAHEVDRNLMLINEYVSQSLHIRQPALYPDDEDRGMVDDFLHRNAVPGDAELIGIAPGSVWATKRWPEEHFVSLLKELESRGSACVLIGGREDMELCRRIAGAVKSTRVCSSAGELSFLQSAELIRRCWVLVTNDSAPMHLATAVGTRVVALFGPTVPRFGFGPLGARDIVLGLENLRCRPCSIHGGNKCPIGTFECMIGLRPEVVMSGIKKVVA